MEDSSTLGMLLTYPDVGVDLGHRVQFAPTARSSGVGQAVVGVIGAGNFASLVLLPALVKTRAHLKTIASATGVSAVHAARRFDIQQAASDYHTILDDPDINTVFIATRHHTHGRMVVEALRAGKHVFVEKPLALNREELVAVRDAWERAADWQLMVGFNRRFSPLAIKMRSLLAGRAKPMSVIYTVNAGAIPADHWTQDPQRGGGRIVGEGCHFIDLIRYLVGRSIVGLEARMMGAAPGVTVREDKMTILLDFADGSTGAVHYLANGSKRYPKERVEIFSEGRVLVLDNFRTLRGVGWKGFRRKRLWRQDKGHAAEVAAFVDRVVEGGAPLIPWCVLEEVTLATFQAVERAAEASRPLLPLDGNGPTGQMEIECR
jgi:predicted dehydrogenase